MGSSNFLWIYFMFIIIIIASQKDNIVKQYIIKKMKRGRVKMNNELLKKYIGNVCRVYTGSFGTQATGKIMDIVDNWIEIQTKKGLVLINADFVTSVTPLNKI